MTYPEFKDRLLEDIPYEEYTAAMNGFVKYVVSRCFITWSDPGRSGGIRFRGKEYAWTVVSDTSARSLAQLGCEKRMNVVPCAQLTTCLPIQQKGGQQLRGAMINLGIRFLVLCIENVPHSSPFIKTWHKTQNFINPILHVQFLPDICNPSD